MKVLLLCVAGVLVMSAGSIHAMEFEKVFGGPARDRGIFVSPTLDGGYIAVGATSSSGKGNADIYLVRVDAAGELLWHRTYGGTEEDNGWAVHEIADGFILSGFTKSFGAGGYDFYLIKTDSDGTTEWSKTYGAEGDDRCWSLALTKDGGFLLAGETVSSGAGEEDFLVVRTDSLGTEIWSRTYGGEKGDRCFSIARADDGGFVLAGQTYSEGAGDRDAYVVKIGASGDLGWSRTFGGADSDVAHSITRVSDGSFVVFGYTTSLAANEDDPYLIKIDDQGETVWTRVLSIEGVNHTLTGEQATDGGFFLVGFSRYQNGRVTKALLVKTDPDGSLAWYRDVLAAEIGESFGYTVRATIDGGCVFAGHTTIGSAGNYDLLLVKVEDEAR